MASYSVDSLARILGSPTICQVYFHPCVLRVPVISVVSTVSIGVWHQCGVEWVSDVHFPSFGHFVVTAVGPVLDVAGCCSCVETAAVAPYPMPIGHLALFLISGECLHYCSAFVVSIS